ncbi:33213_t:CDS:2, partial [Gigaspora margarita]
MEIYFPIITVIKNIIIKCNSIYENAQYNKAICGILLDRAMSAELLIYILERQIKEGEERFEDKAYYYNIIKFKNILDQFANFANDVSQLYFQNKFDICINDLHFAISIVYYEQQLLDKQKIEFDLKNMMEKIDDKLDLSTQEMKISLEKGTSNIQ